MLEITLDPSFPCGDEKSPDNKWKMILSDSKKINLRRPFSQSVYPIEELQ
jgi:hypothetical protein